MAAFDQGDQRLRNAGLDRQIRLAQPQAASERAQEPAGADVIHEPSMWIDARPPLIRNAPPAILRLLEERPLVEPSRAIEREHRPLRGDAAAQTRAAARRSWIAALTPSTGTRSCVIASRSRIVTAPSSSDSTSTVTHHGVPTSSWRR